MASEDDSKSEGLLGFLTQAASVGTVLKTLAALIVGLIATSTGVYKYFAKTSQLNELQCAVVDQNEINMQMTRSAQEIRTALTALKQNLDAPGNAASSKAVSDALSEAIINITKALDKVEETHEAMQKKGIKGGDEKC